MKKDDPDEMSLDVIHGSDVSETREVLEKQLERHQQHLLELPSNCSTFERAKVLLDIAETALYLEKKEEAWEIARDIFDIFLEEKRWQQAVECCDILYQSDQPDSIVALAQGVWLAVTYPVNPGTTVGMLHYIVDETPDDSDGAAVAAMTAYYVADLRAEGKEHESLTFLSTQLLASVAKRHRGIEDQDSLNIWIESLELNDEKKLLARLATMVDMIVGDNWWFDRDALRSELPVN